MSQPLILEKHDGFYSIPMFASFGVRALFTTRRYDMAFDRGGRPTAFKKMGVDPEALVCPSQVHGDVIVVVQKKHKGRGAVSRSTALQETDALISAASGVPVAVLTADCLPVLFYAPDRKVVAATHVGWRGLRKQIVEKTVRRMADDFGADPSRMIAVLGPAIRPCCYEVGREFGDIFPDNVVRRSSRIFFDIASESLGRLTGVGLDPNRIYDSRLCTSCAGDEFFSYRREGSGAGRSMALIGIL